jgi:hypothetical protein
MSDLIHAKTVCRQCQVVLGAGDNYCRRCGMPTGTSGGSGTAIPVGASAAPSPEQFRYWESPWLVLTLLFLVLGPFAIPLLWRSRRFTLLWKNILTAVVLGLAVLLVWDVWLILQQALGPWRELQELLQH